MIVQTDPAVHVVGANPLPLPPGVISEAVYGGPRSCYRYQLHWYEPASKQATAVMWLMMNPSVAGHDCADRTVLKCWSYTQKWGYGAMYVGNSMTYRATDQSRLREVDDPIGPTNRESLRDMARRSGLIICAYGKPKASKAKNFGSEAADFLRVHCGLDLYVMALARDGTPMHPLYLPGDCRPKPWRVV